jgi:DNA repair photolyase
VVPRHGQRGLDVTDQPGLFESEESADDGIVRIQPRTILTKASGFMSAYDYTLNPYSGCQFGCNYCYAAFFVRDKELIESWGDWVEAKANAVEVLRRMRTDLRGKSIYMSSVTDPYQPVERRLGLVRELLTELLPRQPKLVIQTRGPLVTRDIDLLSQFDEVRVNMTVTTDSEQVRRAFEPTCPSNTQRLDAIREVQDAGIETCITMTPLLPVENPQKFAQRLLATGVRRFVVQPFHTSSGRFVAGTRDAAVEMSKRLNWSEDRYRATVEVLRAALPHLDEGKHGFAP